MLLDDPDDHDDDAPHCSAPLKAWRSRLRQAFSPGDFEAVFAQGTQPPVFARPPEAVRTVWKVL